MTVTAAIIVGNPKTRSRTREQWVERWGPAVLTAAQRRAATRKATP